MAATVRYIVAPADPRAHLFHVRAEIPAVADDAHTLRLPSWIRGSYLLRDFAKHIVALSAQRESISLPIERLDKRSLRIAGGGPLILEYSVYAFDESVRKAWLDTRRGFFNGSSLFYCPIGFEHGPFEVQIERPSDAACEGWKVATSLRAVSIDADGFGLYAADDYEELIDHPVELGRFERLDFDVDGVPHALVLSGRYDLDRARLIDDVQKICHVEREMFGQQPMLDQYLFLTNVVAAGYGGLEHRSSTALICSRGDLPRPGAGLTRDYRTFLGLCSHEYFHLWNVKRITAQSFLASDLGAEAYTRDLWHYEGVTSYYDDLFLLRAGIIDAASYLDALAETATRLQRAPARLLHTLADASFETWIKYYQPDENSPNASTNYYVKGALVALCLDLKLRLHSSITLDEVMRTLWQRYGAAGVGVPEGGIEQVAQEISGIDLTGFFDQALRATGELPLAALLAEFGITAELRAAHSPIDEGGRNSGKAVGAWIGLKLRAGDISVAQVISDSPAQRAGLAAGDQLIAIDGFKVNAGNWHKRLEMLSPGQDYAIHFFRGDELFSSNLTAAAVPLDTWTLTLAEASAEPLQRRQSWLGH